ncbi:hypothetical protein HID58_029759, partial [Brassica napus]
IMGFAAIWNSHPKKYGPGSRTCRVCGNSHGLIRKYGLNCCRQCFRSNAKEIGFIKKIRGCLSRKSHLRFFWMCVVAVALLSSSNHKTWADLNTSNNENHYMAKLTLTLVNLEPLLN